jgi:hypothetical protein
LVADLSLPRRAVKLGDVSEFSQLIERIDVQCHRAVAAGPQAGSAREQVEDLLSEGYLAALTHESRSRRIADRLEALAQTLENEASALEARNLALEKRTVDQRVRVLRARLQGLREHFMRLGGHAPASR